MRSALSFALGAAAGAAAAHLLDPENGASRRAQLREQASNRARQGAAGAQAQAQHVADRAQGAAASATGRTRLEDPDDVTLARKVETEIFRDQSVPKGDVSIDVEAGVAYLRGAVGQEWIERLGAAAAEVEGITGVQNLLHAPGTPAPEAPVRGAITEQMG
jgi:osmotically-inducible protein OsmY